VPGRDRRVPKSAPEGSRHGLAMVSARTQSTDILLLPYKSGDCKVLGSSATTNTEKEYALDVMKFESVCTINIGCNSVSIHSNHKCYLIN
jgi:hypothetical protein